jgi:hypothetical protein
MAQGGAAGLSLGASGLAPGGSGQALDGSGQAMDRSGPAPDGSGLADGELPELAGVSWRARVDERTLVGIDRRWTRWTIGQELPFLAAAAALPLLSALLAVVSVFALAFAWFIPHLYAARGAGVVAPPRPWGSGGVGRSACDEGAESRALGLLGDLVGHDARTVLAETGFAIEPGAFGAWLIGPAGALLVRPGGRRVQCYCVHPTGDELPRADRIAHLLLALRSDEAGFATVANLSFSGARWRVRRCLTPEARAGLDAAVAVVRSI